MRLDLVYSLVQNPRKGDQNLLHQRGSRHIGGLLGFPNCQTMHLPGGSSSIAQIVLFIVELPLKCELFSQTFGPASFLLHFSPLPFPLCSA